MIKSDKQASRRPRANEQITVREVRLIDQDDEMVGVVSLRAAQEAAQEAGLDLVEMSPNAEPPVCKIMDYGKFIYDQDKKQSAAKKKQKQTQVKEIKFRPVTEEGDYQVKLRNLIRFLEKGDKVKVTMRFRGRELAHQELGLQILERVKNDLAGVGDVEQHPKREGRQLIMVLGPTRK